MQLLILHTIQPLVAAHFSSSTQHSVISTQSSDKQPLVLMSLISLEVIYDQPQSMIDLSLLFNVNIRHLPLTRHLSPRPQGCQTSVSLTNFCFRVASIPAARLPQLQQSFSVQPSTTHLLSDSAAASNNSSVHTTLAHASPQLQLHQLDLLLPQQSVPA